MSIYSRDNTDYATMIDNMIKNRQETDRIRSDNIRKQGEIWSNFSKDTGNMIARGMDYLQYYNEQKELENKLKDLEERREHIRSQYDYNADYKPYTTTPAYKASEQMKGYNSDYDVNLLNTGIGDKYKTASTYITDSAKDQWLRAHPGMTEEDYELFVEYQNALYGGR